MAKITYAYEKDTRLKNKDNIIWHLTSKFFISQITFVGWRFFSYPEKNQLSMKEHNPPKKACKDLIVCVAKLPPRFKPVLFSLLKIGVFHSPLSGRENFDTTILRLFKTIFVLVFS